MLLSSLVRATHLSGPGASAAAPPPRGRSAARAGCRLAGSGSGSPASGCSNSSSSVSPKAGSGPSATSAPSSTAPILDALLVVELADHLVGVDIELAERRIGLVRELEEVDRLVDPDALLVAHAGDLFMYAKRGFRLALSRPDCFAAAAIRGPALERRLRLRRPLGSLSRHLPAAIFLRRSMLTRTSPQRAHGT